MGGRGRAIRITKRLWARDMWGNPIVVGIYSAQQEEAEKLEKERKRIKDYIKSLDKQGK